MNKSEMQKAIRDANSHIDSLKKDCDTTTVHVPFSEQAKKININKPSPKLTFRKKVQSIAIWFWSSFFLIMLAIAIFTPPMTAKEQAIYDKKYSVESPKIKVENPKTAEEIKEQNILIMFDAVYLGGVNSNSKYAKFVRETYSEKDRKELVEFMIVVRKTKEYREYYRRRKGKYR